MSRLRVEHITRQDGQTLIYRLGGILGESAYAYEFLEEVRRQVREGPSRIVLNLEHLEYVTSSGVGVIAAALVSARRAKKSLVLVATPSQVRHVLEICGVYDQLPHFETEDEAVAQTV